LRPDVFQTRVGLALALTNQRHLTSPALWEETAGRALPLGRPLIAWFSNSKGCYWCGCCEFGVRVSRIGDANPTWHWRPKVDADPDTLVTALDVSTDDFLIDNPQHRPWRPTVGITRRLDDAELVTLVVAQAPLGFTSQARWLC
jgi:hypothetical protein